MTAKLAGTRDLLATIVAGKTWSLPLVLQPLTGGQFDIPAQSRNQALQLQHILLPSS